jgi:heme exporter protein C
MTSTLILFLIYLGIVALWRAFDDPGRAGRVIAVFTLVGALDIPVVKYSVDWWNTLHQPASISLMGDEHMPPSMLIPLLVMTFAFTLLFVTLHLVRMRTEIGRRRLTTLERQAAARLAG